MLGLTGIHAAVSLRLDPGPPRGYTSVIRRHRRAQQAPREQADRRLQGRARAGRAPGRDAPQERIHSQCGRPATVHRVPALPRDGHPPYSGVGDELTRLVQQHPLCVCAGCGVRSLPLSHPGHCEEEASRSSRSSAGGSSIVRAAGPRSLFATTATTVGRAGAQEARVRQLQRGVPPKSSTLGAKLRRNEVPRDTTRRASGKPRRHPGPRGAMRGAGALRSRRPRRVAGSVQSAVRVAVEREASRVLAGVGSSSPARRRPRRSSRVARPARLRCRRRGRQVGKSCEAWALRRAPVR